MENAVALFGSFDEFWCQKSCRRKRQLWSILAILTEKLVHTELDDGATGDDSDEGILVVYHRDKVLCAGAVYQIFHGGGDPDWDIILSAGNFHDAMDLGLANIHMAHIFQAP